jgi:site-specific recombinase XerD
MYQFLDWCEANGHTAALDRDLVRAWVADMLAAGSEPATARARQLGVRRFSAWCEAEGEIPSDPLLGLKAPKLDVKVTASLTDDQVRALVKACSGTGFLDRRDEALVRLLVETGMRAGEVLALTVDDLDLIRGQVRVVRGKGGKGRVAPFGSTTRARWTATSGPVAPTGSSTPRRCGWVTAARVWPTTACGARWPTGQSAPGSRGFTYICCVIPPRVAGWPLAAARAA